jgi:5-methylcytosine-specific restriction enzyme A
MDVKSYQEYQKKLSTKKLDAAKKDLEYWKSLSETIGQPERGHPDFMLCDSCQLMGPSCQSYDLGKCIFDSCKHRPSYQEWQKHHINAHPKDELLYVRCDECKRIQDEETRFMEGRIAELEIELNAQGTSFDPNKEFKASEYVSALQNLEIAPHYRKMLLFNYFAPNQTLTANEMAKFMGYDHFAAANLHYGTLGGIIGELLGLNPLPEFKVRVLVDFGEKPNAECQWIMKPVVAEALELLSWTKEWPKFPEEIAENEPMYEGAVKRIPVNAYERNDAARRICLDHYGYRCSVCGKILSDIYGEVAQAHIHVHHLKPLSEINSEYQIDPIADLRPVCPTCHSIMHLRKSPSPPYSIEEVQGFIKAAQGKATFNDD